MHSGHTAGHVTIAMRSCRLQKASNYVGNHPAAIDSASVRLLEASHPKAQPTAIATWKWDILRPVQLIENEVGQQGLGACYRR